MFGFPYFILSTIQAGTTTILNVFCMTWTQHQTGFEHIKPIPQCYVTLNLKILNDLGLHMQKIIFEA